MSGKNKIERENTKGFVRTLESLLEVLILTVMYYIIWRVGYGADGFPAYSHNGKYVLMGLYALLTYLLFENMDGFMFGNLRKTDLIITQIIAIFMVNFITYFQLCLIANALISPIPVLVLFAIDVIMEIAFVYIYVSIYYQLYAPHNMIMVFGTDNAMVLKVKMDTRRDKYKIKKLINVDEGFDKIIEEIVKYDAVVINDVPTQIRNDILKFCYKNRIRAYVVPKISDVLMRGARDISLFDTPIVMVKGTGLTVSQRFCKRLFDIVMSLLLMVPILPVMLIIAIAIKIEDGGPAFYKQERVTVGGRPFQILKFRSMIVNAEKLHGAVMATDNDPRITKVGRFIRATRLDELPQIFNIFIGDMSFVGPRPERTEYAVKYLDDIPEFDYRLKVKGGLTGYAQVYGKYNTSAYDKLRLDLMYIENYSFWLDMKLILLTLRIIFIKSSTEGVDKAAENGRIAVEIADKIKHEHDADRGEEEL